MIGEFVVEQEEDNTFNLIHRGCGERTELHNDKEIPIGPSVEHINEAVEEHLRTVHGVVRFDYHKCPTAADHPLVEFCGNCGYKAG